MNYRVPLVLTPQAEGGYTVTSPLLPELITDGDSACEALENAKDAIAAVIELYEDLGRPLPESTVLSSHDPLSETAASELPPVVSRLMGSLAGTKVDMDDHRAYLEGKYG